MKIDGECLIELIGESIFTKSTSNVMTTKHIITFYREFSRFISFVFSF